MKSRLNITGKRMTIEFGKVGKGIIGKGKTVGYPAPGARDLKRCIYSSDSA